MPIMEISIVPIGTKDPSLSRYVASCIRILKRKNRIKMQLTAMGTIVEANSLNALLDVAAEMHRQAFACGARRVLTTIKIDERTDKKISIEGKVRSVAGKLRTAL